MQTPRRIFISYARKDASDIALRLRDDLAKNGFDVWLDTQRIQGGAGWTQELERAVDNADAVLAILTRGSYVSAICRAEQLRSLRKGKKVIPLLAQNGSDIPLHLEPANYRDFSAPAFYDVQLQSLLGDLMGRSEVAILASQFRTTLVTAPPLPRNYLPRPDALTSLREAVITEDPGPSIALVALRGMGGIGKTVLAQALSHDEVVQQAFPDGIAWTTVGREPSHNVLTRMQEVRRALGDEPAGNESELHCINRYRTVLREKAALVILDDVWDSAHVEPFLAESPRSKLFFTTRDETIAAGTGARTHSADLLSSEQSRALLARWAGCTQEALPREADDLVAECGRLPLALAMVGAMLRGKPLAYWPYVLMLLQRADLERIRAQFPGYPHANMLRAIEVSVDALDDTARKRYLALAVLPEDVPVVPSVQQTLWDVDEGEALETAEWFVSRSLAHRGGAEQGIRLHDLQLDYVRAKHPDPETLGLIRGAVRLSSDIIAKDPGQFASQVLGRLLPYRSVLPIEHFICGIAAATPRTWLQPVHPALDAPGTSLLWTLRGHSDTITCVALTPDAKQAVSASWDKSLKVWDLDSGRVVRTLEGHSSWVSAVAVMPDGKRAVSASLDRTVRIWDLERGRVVRSIEGHSYPVNSVAVTRDGRSAVCASSDGTLKVWDLDSGRVVRTLEGHSDTIFAVAVTPDGKGAVSASADNTLKVWNLESGRRMCTLEGHSSFVRSVAVTSDGHAVSASDDGSLKVWDLESGRELRMLEGHSLPVCAVAVTSDGKRAVSASGDKTLKVWDLTSGSILRTLEGHSDHVLDVAVTPDGRRAVSASADRTLKVWNLENAHAWISLEHHSASVSKVVLAAYGKRAVSASGDKTIKIWDVESGRILRTLDGHSQPINDVAVTPDGRSAVSASSDNTLKLWEIDSGRVVCTLEGHSDTVTGVAIAPNGKQAVSTSWDQTLRVWDLGTRCTLRTLEGHAQAVRAVAVTPDGNRAVSASEDKTLKVWELDTGRIVRTLEGHSDGVFAVAVTPDGKSAVSASSDQTLKVWHLESGRVMRTLKHHSDGVVHVAMAPNGRLAVSASWDNTVKLWVLGSGLVLATFTCDAAALCCAFAGDHSILAGDGAGRVHFLKLENGRRKENCKQDPGILRPLDISPF